MKKTLFTCLFSLSVLASYAINPAEGTPASTNIPEAVYPCVDANSRATFKLHAPEAKDVKVDICGKKYDMSKDAEGNWMATTDPLVKGFHYYFLLVDGVQVNDPASETFFGCGRQASGIEIPEDAQTAAYYTFNKDVAHGQVRECKYYSATEGGERRCFVYTPAE